MDLKTGMKSTLVSISVSIVIVDNYLKIIMILQRARVREPVVIMGETGCGKTYLVKYIVKVLFKHYAEYKEFIFHTGVEEEEFKNFMYDIIDRANEELRKRETGKGDERPITYWVFFDEFNTSHLQAFVSEMMNDRVFSLGNSKKSKREM